MSRKISDKLIEMGVEVLPFKIETEKCDGDKSIIDTWITYRDEFLKYSNDGKSIEWIKTGKLTPLDKYYKDLFDMDLSVSYFNNIKLKITCSLAFREFIFSFGDHARWGLSSRDSKSYITRLACSDEMSEIQNNPAAYKEFIEWKNKYDAGDAQFDEMREHLPLAHQTQFVIQLPVKQFIKYLAIYYSTFRDSMNDSWRKIYVACYNNTDLRPWLTKIPHYTNIEESRLLRFKGRLARFEDSDTINSSIDRIYQNKVFKYLGKIGSGLYSQLIRHESILPIGWVDHMLNMNKMEVPNCKVPFDTYVHTSDTRLGDIVKTRTSWFASSNADGDHNSWIHIINQLIVCKDGRPLLKDNKHIFKWFDEDGEFYPEATSKYDVDLSTRFYKGYNRFWVDPVALEYPEIIFDRLLKLGYSKVMDLYLQHFTEGYFKDNPNNSYRIQWDKWAKECKYEGLDPAESNTDYSVYTVYWEMYRDEGMDLKYIINLMKDSIK